MLNWLAAIISSAGCTTATLLDWLNVTRFCPVGKKKPIQQTKKRDVGRGSKSHIKRHNLGEQTDIFEEISYKLLLGEKHNQWFFHYCVDRTQQWLTDFLLSPKHRLLPFTRNRKNKIQADRLMVMSNKRWADSQCYTVYMELNGIKYNNAPRIQQRVHSHSKSRIINDNCMRNPTRKTEKNNNKKLNDEINIWSILKKNCNLTCSVSNSGRSYQNIWGQSLIRDPLWSPSLPPRLFKSDILMGLLVWEWAKGQPHTCFNHWASVTKDHLWEATAKTIPWRGKLKSFYIATISAHLGSKFSNIHSTGHTGHLFHT